MTGFNHGMTGAVIALAVKKPELALPLAFISHYVTDLIPHFGFEQKKVLGRAFNRFLAADFLLAVVSMIILALLFPAHILLIWSCMILAAAPDIIWWFYRKSVKAWPEGLDKFTAWHYRINNRFHVNHLYFDVTWFGLTWAIAIWFKVK
jgi:hypothetical protein